MKKCFGFFALILCVNSAFAAQGDYVSACGRLQINDALGTVKLDDGNRLIELENFNPIAYSNGQSVCVTGYEGRSFTGKVSIQVMITDSH